MLKNLIVFFCLIVLAALSAEAHYIIHSTTPGVKIENNTGSTVAEKGKEVKANEFLIIPDGGEVEIYNDLDKNIYKSTNTGKISVTRLMIDAKKTASDNSKNVAARLRFAKNNENQEGEKIYVEKGMVRRSMEVFDPEASNLQVDSKSLGAIIAGILTTPDSLHLSTVDVEVTTGHVDSTGVFFRIVNTLDFPIYFNVLKFDETPEKDQRKIEISKLGQPDGSYVLLPGQAITRESFASMPNDETHLLVLTHFRYDLDEVVEEAVNSLEETNGSPKYNLNFPLLIKNLQ